MNKKTTDMGPVGLAVLVIGALLLAALLPHLPAYDQLDPMAVAPGAAAHGTRTDLVTITPVSSSSASIAPGSTESLTFNVTNSAGEALTGVSIELHTDSLPVPGGVSYTIAPASEFNLPNTTGNGSYQIVYFNVTVSSDVGDISWTPKLQAYVGRAESDTLSLSVTVSASYGVSLSLRYGDEADKQTVAGHPSAWLIVVTNDGNDADTFSLSYAGTGTWDAGFLQDQGIWGEYDTSRATWSDASSYLEDGLESFLDGDSILDGEQDVYDAYNLFIDDLSITEVTVSAGASRTVLFTCTPPSTASAGDSQSITITAESQADGTQEDTLSLSLAINASTTGYAVSLSASTTDQEIAPGETVEFDVVVSGGTIAENVLVSVLTECAPALGWSVVVTDAAGTEILEPGIFADVEIGGLATDVLAVSNDDARSATIAIPASGSVTITVSITAPEGAGAIAGIDYRTIIGARVMQDLTRSAFLDIGSAADDTFTGSAEDRTVATAGAFAFSSAALLMSVLALAVLAGAAVYYWYAYRLR